VDRAGIASQVGCGVMPDLTDVSRSHSAASCALAEGGLGIADVTPQSGAVDAIAAARKRPRALRDRTPRLDVADALPKPHRDNNTTTAKPGRCNEEEERLHPSPDRRTPIVLSPEPRVHRLP
jgi:hypothetical protein